MADPQEFLMQLSPEKRSQFLQMMQQQQRGAQSAAPGMLPLPQPGQPQMGRPLPGQPQMGRPLPGQPQMGQPPGQPQMGQPPPGAATPEEAAKARAETLRRAGAGAAAVGATGPGMLDTPRDGGNIFADNPNWFAGLFDTSNKVGAFDSFYTDRARSNSWL